MHLLKKSLLALIFGFSFCTMLQAQDALIDKFGSEAINSIQGTEKLAILEFQNLHGYAVQDLNGLKDISEYPDALEIQAVNGNGPSLSEAILTSGNFELFGYSFPVSGTKNNYYRIGDTGKLLIIYSTNIVKELYNQKDN